MQQSALAGRVGFDRQKVSQHLAFVVAVHGAIGRRVEHVLTLLRWHVAEYAEGATHLLFALRVHVAKLLRRTEEGLTLPRAEPFEVFIAADPALALLRRHGIQLMETIDEALLLLLRQGVESLLAAKRVFLAGKGLALMALEPGT